MLDESLSSINFRMLPDSMEVQVGVSKLGIYIFQGIRQTASAFPGLFTCRTKHFEMQFYTLAKTLRQLCTYCYYFDWS
jgi:hypothetical protein